MISTSVSAHYENQSIRAMLESTKTHTRIFVTISGAHLYGFASPDSDYDLRGVFVLPDRDCLGIVPTRDTMEKMDIIDNVEVDYVAHDIGKYALLMLKKNGYVLEQIFSPMVLITSPEHDQLKRLGELCITRHHAFHYLGFAANQWKNIRLPDRSEGNTLPTTPILVKPLLYTYRTLLTGIHIMKSGEIEANLVTLNADSRSAIIDDLIQLKKSGAEHETIDDTDLTHSENLYTKLVSDLETAHQACTLHDIVSRETRLELNELVVNVRLAAV